VAHRRSSHLVTWSTFLLGVAQLGFAQVNWPAECLGQLAPSGPLVTISWPLEIDGGAALGRETPTPFIASLRMTPTFRLDGGRYELGPSLVIAYLNPKFEGLAGVRGALRIWNAELPEAPIASALVSIDGLFGTRGSRQVLGSVRADVGGVLIVSVFGGRDFGHDETLVGLRLGTDLSWLRAARKRTVFPPPAPPVKDERFDDTSDYYPILSVISRREALATFYVPPPPVGVPAPTTQPRSALAAEMRSFLQNERSQRMPGSISELTERLPPALVAAFPSSAIDRWTREARDIAERTGVSVPANPEAAQLTEAVLRGWCQASALVE
jgi:hypothetical protein